MDKNLMIFLVMVVTISATLIGVVLTSWIRARAGGSTEAGELAERKVELISNENADLRDQIGKLAERLRVLERIATDPAERTARQIEELR